MAATPLLLLTGLRCSGKTTLGRRVAQTLRRPFQDLDPLVLARLGAASVTEAFERVGEAGWRQAETEALRQALQEVEGVLALGGGTPTAPGAASLMRKAQADGDAVVALLDPGADELVRRLAAARGDRPKLAEDDRAEVTHLRATRLPLYRSMADAVVDTRRSEAACVHRLAQLLTTGRWTWPSWPASG